jgi:fumarylpyruvate hydrolase
MANTVFPVPAPVLAPIQGSDETFPVNRIFCVGRNYLAHAAEMGVAVDKSKQEPFYFNKHPAYLVESGAAIDYPPQTENYHYEMEFVVAIGKAGFEVSQEDADELIWGYACGLDMTRRDLQLKAREQGRPWELAVNGETKQSSNPNLLIWNVREIIEHLSRFYHLQPGDIIYTGTPEGVGPVVAGDKITGSIESVGEIELTINK